MPAKHIKLHTHSFTAGQISKIEITTAKPIIYLLYSMRLKLTAASWAGASYIPNGILRILRLAQITKSDEPFYQYGVDETLSAAGILLDVQQRNWLGIQPQFKEPPTVLVDHTIEMSWVVPQSLPIQLYGDRDVARSALRVGAVPDGLEKAVSVFDQVKWGTIAADLFTGGTTIAIDPDPTQSYIHVSALTDDGLNTRQFKKPNGQNGIITGKQLYNNFGLDMRTFMSQAVYTVAANPEFQHILGQNGMVLFIGTYNVDNGAANETRVSNIKIQDDDDSIQFDLFWDSMNNFIANKSRADAGAGLPVGYGGFVFDEEATLDGFKAVGRTGFKSLVNVATGTLPSFTDYQQTYVTDRIRSR